MAFDDGTNQDFGNILSALGAGLLTGDRNHMFGPGFTASIQNTNKRLEGQTSRSALEAFLIQKGYSKEDAAKYAMSEATFKAAVDQKDAEKYAGIASGLSSGGVSNLGAPIPKLSPDAPGGPAAGASLNGGALAPPTGTAGDIQNKFIGALKDGGLTNPYGLAAVAAHAQHESGFSPDKLVGSWSDPSQSGQAGTSGGTLSWRNERLANMRAATAGAKDPVTAQAQFTLNEDPAVTAALQNAKSPEEANAIMSRSQRFAGYDKPGGEYAARLATTQAYANRFGQQPARIADATGTAPISPVTRSDVPPLPAGASGLNPGRPVQVANDEAQTQALEGRMGMYPSNVYGITKQAQATATPQGGVSAADMPVPGAKPAEFQIPPAAGQGPTQNKTVAAIAIARQRRREALQQQIDRNEQIGSQLAAGGEKYYKPYQDRIKRTNDALQKQIDKLDEVRTDFEPDPATGGVRYVPGGKNDPAQIKAEAEARAKEDGEKLTAAFEQRKKIAASIGLKPGSGAEQTYLATGKMPKEDSPGLTAGDKKAIQDADQIVLSTQGTIDGLKEAKKLSKVAYEGPTAGVRGYGMSMLGSEGGVATEDLNNLITTQALGQLKSTFGAAPTEGERKILLEIQGSVSKPDAVRQKIFDRAIALAELRKQQNAEKAAELRGQTYYAPGSGAQVIDGRSAMGGQGAAKVSASAAPGMPNIVERKTVGGKTYARTSDGRVFEVSP